VTPATPLGALESDVMDEVWRHGGELRVRDVHAAFQARLAYTTVMTTMDRLYKKGLLERRKDGRAFLYSARLTRQQFVLNAGVGLIRGLLESEGEPALSFLVDAVTERDRELLDRLERMVREKKRQAAKTE
jgi:BlaI family transcriptional regulator, penicillinase repressor